MSDGSGDLGSVAERLRIVKEAQRRFVRLWEIERSYIEPLLDRVAADVKERPASGDDLSGRGASSSDAIETIDGQMDRRTQLDDKR